MRKADFLFTVALVPIDLAMLVAAGLAAYFLRISPLVIDLRPVLFDLSFLYYLTVVFLISTFFIIVFAISGLYKTKAKRGHVEDFFQIVVAVSAGMMAIIIFMFFRHEWFDSRFILLATWFFAILFVTLGRVATGRVRKMLVRRNKFGVEKVLLIGGGEQASLIRSEIQNNPYIGYEVLGHVHEINIGVVRAVVNNPGVRKIILANPGFARDDVIELINFCEDARVDLKFVPDFFGAISANIDIDILNGNPLIELKKTNLEGWGMVTKRIFDLVISIALLPFLLPIFALIALLIKWDSSGPVLARLKRVSQNKEFNLLKFRSMVERAEQYRHHFLDGNIRVDGPLFKMRDDPRITRVGRIVRSKRLDELPQIFNVIKGDISLVGPRPHEPSEIARYERHHKKVLAIKSGITGFAQISGAEQLPFEDEVRLDRYYIENWSLKKDIVILLKTFGILIFGKTEY
jgi:exopolysaccharide biosynthesis polyprenyl glycosylphosphotransferase